ncbi:MAG TPA: YceI family protein [Pyrinomonadaceae bacterium]|jgi:polyisoprenoid-binding protein YceI
MRLKTLTLILSSLLLVACSNPAADKSRAVTGEASSATPQSSASAEKYVINPQNSKIEFLASQVTGSHQGEFQDFSGVIDYAGQPEKSRVNLTINTASVKADADKLTEHLKTADFFDVAKFPQAIFTSTEIKSGGDKGASHTITGNFQLHGITKSISFPATISVTPEAINVESTFSINRRDFGINYAGPTDNLIRDDVVMSLHIKAGKGK